MSIENNRIFDTSVQLLKYKTLKEVICSICNNDAKNMYIDIPKKIISGNKATMRCCVYKERAILSERVKLALGGDANNPNVIEVIDIACDECPLDGMLVSDACRGCISHGCKDACPVDAITIVNKRAVIDSKKCIECKKCIAACPYSAIIHRSRPCVKSCPAGAISMDSEKKAVIDNQKCIECGACVYQCPFGAIVDKSYITTLIDILHKSNNNENYKVYAIIAPAIVSQFKYAKIEQVVTGIKKLGFYDVVETAFGADITIYKESLELKEKGLITSSCCPSFVSYVQKFFPSLTEYISTTPSPMIETARFIKNIDSSAKVVFIGPCSSKKSEIKKPQNVGAVDCVISFEELQAFLDAKEIDISSLDQTPLDNASYFGRIFAKSGGLAKSVIENTPDFDVKPVVMNGIDECKLNLLKLRAGKHDANFFEGMACKGGCINGALCLSHGPKRESDVDTYGNMAKEKDISGAVNLYLLNSK